MGKQDDGPRKVGDLLPDVLALSKQRHEERVQKWLDRGVNLDATVHETFDTESVVGRFLIPLTPKTLTVREFLECTIEEHVIEATKRLTRCHQCPVRGGMCRGESRQGMKPEWGMRYDRDRPGILWDVCPKWRTYALDQRMIKLGFPSKLVPKTFDTYVTETNDLSGALNDVRRWAANYWRAVTTGKGLLLMGDPGIGKTHLAVAACRWLLERRIIKEPRFWDYTNLMGVLREHNDESRIAVREAMRCEILVLDDLNTQRVTDWVREQLGMIINHRWSNNLITIVTSNDSLQSYADDLGARTVSRIEDMCISLDWYGRDWRMSEPPTDE